MSPLRRIAAPLVAVALVLWFGGEARAAPAGPPNSPQSHPTPPTPKPRRSAPSRAPLPVIADVRPSGCLQPGDSRRLLGGDFGTVTDGRSVWLERTDSDIRLATRSWSPQVIEVAVPAGAPLAAGASYALRLRDAQGVWTGARGPRVTACGAAIRRSRLIPVPRS